MDRQPKICIARDFAENPGARYRSDGPKSGEEFREELLEPQFLEAVEAKRTLHIDLDGAEGYATSFLEESFGGLARIHGVQLVLDTLHFKSDDEEDLVAEVQQYIKDATAK